MVRTTEEQREYEKQRMLHFAAQLDQISREIYAFAKNEHKGSLFGNHQMGVAVWSINHASKQLMEHAGK